MLEISLKLPSFDSIATRVTMVINHRRASPPPPNKTTRPREKLIASRGQRVKRYFVEAISLMSSASF